MGINACNPLNIEFGKGTFRMDTNLIIPPIQAIFHGFKKR